MRISDWSSDVCSSDLCGRTEQADEIARAYVAAQPDNARFFDVRNHHFSADQPIDTVLREGFAERLASFEDERDPKEVLLTIGRGEPWQDEDVRLQIGRASGRERVGQYV